MSSLFAIRFSNGKQITDTRFNELIKDDVNALVFTRIENWCLIFGGYRYRIPVFIAPIHTIMARTHVAEGGNA
jgi:hypothetical protein